MGWIHGSAFSLARVRVDDDKVQPALPKVCVNRKIKSDPDEKKFNPFFQIDRLTGGAFTGYASKPDGVSGHVTYSGMRI